MQYKLWFTRLLSQGLTIATLSYLASRQYRPNEFTEFNFECSSFMSPTSNSKVCTSIDVDQRQSALASSSALNQIQDPAAGCKLYTSKEHLCIVRNSVCWFRHYRGVDTWSHFQRWLIHDGACQQTPDHVLLSHTTVAIGLPFTWHRCNSCPCSSAHSQPPGLLQRSACSPIHWEMQAVAVSSESCCSSHLSNAGTCERDQSYTKQTAPAQFSRKSHVQALCAFVQVPPRNCTGISISPSCLNFDCSWKTEICYRRSVGRPVRAKQDNRFKQEFRILCSRGLESFAQTVSWFMWPYCVTGNFQKAP